MCRKLIYIVFFVLLLGIAKGQPQQWNRVAYWDSRYPTAWADGSVTIALRDFLSAAGYTVLNASQLKT
jgi:hypothetical protein